MKSYAQHCPIAVALDAVGDRWALLILRELAMGDQRFTDLRSALTGIAPNLLSARLGELVDRGLVTKAELPPPAARTVYRLTDRGQDARPVLSALARFGVADLPVRPGRPMPPRRALYALLFAFYRASARGPLARARVVVDDVPFDVALGAGPTLVPGGFDPTSPPQVTVTVAAEALLDARRGGEALAARVEGPADAASAFFAAFTLPESAARG